MASEKNKLELEVAALTHALEANHAATGWQAGKKWFEEHFSGDVVARLKFLDSVLYAKTPFVHDPKSDVQEFKILQGDIVRSTMVKLPDPVHEFNEHQAYYYIVIHPSCSIQPKRHRWVLTSRLIEVLGSDGNSKGLLKDALTFKSSKFFYCPSLPDQSDKCIGNLACFEEVSYIENSVLQVADRVASLSDVGWHMFNAFLVHSFTRPSSDDKKIRANSSPLKVCLE